MKFNSAPLPGYSPTRTLLFSFGMLLLLIGPGLRADEWTASPPYGSTPVPDTRRPVLGPPQPYDIPPPVFPGQTPAAAPRQPVVARPASVQRNIVPAKPAGLATRVMDEEQPAPVAVGTPKWTLQQCIDRGLELQPGIAAQQASLAAAQDGYRGLSNLGFSRFFVRGYNIRKQQAWLGIQIASAGLGQSEWDTRYAITRNFYSVIYARKQSALVNELVGKLDRAHKRAVDLVKIGDPKIKVNQIDVDNLFVAREKTRAKGLQASFGVTLALAALHEAIGLPACEKLDVADEPLPALVEDLDLQNLICLALSQRGEVAQVAAALQVTNLEVDAQARACFAMKQSTSAMASDYHAAQVPQGRSNGDYVPGGVALEMPPMLVGPRQDRMDRARDFAARAAAVVDKTQNLVVLETKASYYKWQESSQRVKILNELPKKAEATAQLVGKRFYDGNVSGEDYLRARAMADLTQSELNEALYNHALGLAALERITAGGYRIPTK